MYNLNEVASKLTLQQPLHGRKTVRRRSLLLIDTILNDNGLDDMNELRTPMIHRATWKQLTMLR